MNIVVSLIVLAALIGVVCYTSCAKSKDRSLPKEIADRL